MSEESENELSKCATAYGRQHGTAFFFCRQSPRSFLSFMLDRYGELKFKPYLEGFLDALSGKYRRKYRHFKGLTRKPKVSEPQ